MRFSASPLANAASAASTAPVESISGEPPTSARVGGGHRAHGLARFGAREQNTSAALPRRGPARGASGAPDTPLERSRSVLTRSKAAGWRGCARSSSARRRSRNGIREESPPRLEARAAASATLAGSARVRSRLARRAARGGSSATSVQLTRLRSRARGGGARAPSRRPRAGRVSARVAPPRVAASRARGRRRRPLGHLQGRRTPCGGARLEGARRPLRGVELAKANVLPPWGHPAYPRDRESEQHPAGRGARGAARTRSRRWWSERGVRALRRAPARRSFRADPSAEVSSVLRGERDRLRARPSSSSSRPRHGSPGADRGGRRSRARRTRWTSGHGRGSGGARYVDGATVRGSGDVKSLRRRSPRPTRRSGGPTSPRKSTPPPRARTATSSGTRWRRRRADSRRWTDAWTRSRTRRTRRDPRRSGPQERAKRPRARRRRRVGWRRRGRSRSRASSGGSRGTPGARVGEALPNRRAARAPSRRSPSEAGPGAGAPGPGRRTVLAPGGGGGGGGGGGVHRGRTGGRRGRGDGGGGGDRGVYEGERGPGDPAPERGWSTARVVIGLPPRLDRVETGVFNEVPTTRARVDRQRNGSPRALVRRRPSAVRRGRRGSAWGALGAPLASSAAPCWGRMASRRSSTTTRARGTRGHPDGVHRGAQARRGDPTLAFWRAHGMIVRGEPL